MHLRTVESETGWGILLVAHRARWIVVRESDRRVIADYCSLDYAVTCLGHAVDTKMREWEYESTHLYYRDGLFTLVRAATGEIISESRESPREQIRLARGLPIESEWLIEEIM